MRQRGAQFSGLGLGSGETRESELTTTMNALARGPH
jgi:hypothetical protein